MNSLSVVFTGQNKVELIEKDVPALKSGEMLIKTKVSMISIGTELTVLTRENLDENCAWMSGFTYPYDAGYANVGEVIAVADDEDKNLLGKLVLSLLPHTQYGVSETKSNWIRWIPDGVSAEEASFGILAEIAYQGVRRGRSTWGESAVVYGAGLIGQLAVDALLRAGACPIIVCDTSDNRLSYLPDEPEIIKVNPKRDDVKEIVKEATHGRMADAVYEVTGVSALIPQEMELLHDQGRIVILSSPRGKTTIDFHDLVNRTSCEIIGAHNMSHTPVATNANPWTNERDFEIFTTSILNGRTDVKRLISHRESYRDSIEVYRKLVEDRTQAMGVLFDWAD